MAPPKLAPQRFKASHLSYTNSPKPLPSCSKGSRGLSVLPRVLGIFTAYFNFAESLVETVGKSLRHSCRSELTRQGISLP